MIHRILNTLWRWIERFAYKTAKRYDLSIESLDRANCIFVQRHALAPGVNEGNINIDQQHRVDEVLSFFIAKKSGWIKPWDTAPSGSFSVTFFANGEILRTFYVSNILVVWGKSGEHLWRELEEGEHDRLRRLLGMETYDAYVQEFREHLKRQQEQTVDHS